MKKIMLFVLCFATSFSAADAYVQKSSKDLGSGDARNQNVVVQCTTDAGKVSNQTCQLRRYAKCSVGASGKKNCNGWQYWKDLRDPSKSYPDWRKGAESCCKAKGLR